MISNVDVYLAIANDSHAEMTRQFNAGRRPKPDGSPGFIVTYDPSRSSFKQALICIAFCAMYFEALVYLVARTRLSKSKAEEIDRFNSYARRLESLGVHDQSLLQSAETLRSARRDLVHEKAILPTEIGSKPVWRAQSVADDGIAFVHAVSQALSAAP
jgi:hypothetical protein